MDFDRWYRKTERKASARIWQGAMLALTALILSGLLATTGKGAGTLVRHIVEILAWVPAGLFAVALALVMSGAWTVWRLHADPGSVYEER